MTETIVCPAGENVRNFLQHKGYGTFYCGGKGVCGKCRAQVLKGDTGKLTEAEKNLLTPKEIADSVRLLCQIGTVAAPVTLCIKRNHNEAFTNRLFSHETTGQGQKPKETDAGKRFGAAFDIGTTTIVGKLFDLDRKHPIVETAAWNPQGCFGADIITRMQYCLEQPEHIRHMQKKITDCLNGMLNFFKQSVLSSLKEEKEIKICRIAAAGNSAMTHFLLGETIDSLAKAPFRPLFTEGQEKNGKDYGLDTEEDITLYTLPLLQGQIGGDITAALLSIDIFSKAENTMLIDIGTNGEIAFFRGGNIYICSTAAGPALEGAGLSHGMRAEPGAIERVWLTGGKVYTKVISSLPAQGICGSALIDSVAVLLDLGKIHSNGYLEYGSFSLTASSDTSSAHIELTQEDIRQYQMVKGAVRAGIETLIHAAHADLNDIQQLFIAGSFGSNIQKRNAVRTGLLPEIAPEKITMIGNASLTGASMALLSKEARQYAEKIRKSTVHIDLTKETEFQKLYIKYMNF